MNRFPGWANVWRSLGKFIYSKLGLLALTILGVSVLCWSIFVKASPQASPELEQQVLQIIRTNPEVIIESIQAYQQQQQEKRQQARQALLKQIKTNPTDIIGDSPTKGSQEINIVLLEFSDFQCPYCALAQKTIQKFIDRYPQEVTLVYKHLPLASIHPEGIPAAQAAWAAQQQGKFWAYHDALFARQKELGEDLYLSLARELKLDLEQFNRDRQAAIPAIEKDLAMAQQLGIQGTPFFVMNDRTFSGAVKLAELESILETLKAENSN